MDKLDVKIIDLALQEDIGRKDITATLIHGKNKAHAIIVSKQEAVICGRSFVDKVFSKIDPKVKITWLIKDGMVTEKNQVLCRISGPAKSILTGERTALNFLQTLSGTATLTKKFVDKIKKTKTKLLDTRKTIPGLRLAQKYAVRCGGGTNHRLGLYDMILIKENHIAACGSITKAVNKAKQLYPNKKIEVEVRNLREFKEAQLTQADIVMLDNFSLKAVKKAIKMHSGKAKLEASGGVNLKNILSFAKTGIDYISVGNITKTLVSVDLSLLFITD